MTEALNSRFMQAGNSLINIQKVGVKNFSPLLFYLIFPSSSFK